MASHEAEAGPLKKVVAKTDSVIAEVRDLTYRPAGLNSRARPLLDDVSFTVRSGEYVVLMGPNGSGKTTLIKHFNGLLVPSQGEVRVMNMATADASSLAEIRRHVGLVFQDPDDQMVAVTVEDEIAFGLENLRWSHEAMQVRVDETLRRFHLQAVRERATTSLSGGEQQRVAIAAVWAMDPELLILDEPTSMLDRRSAAELLRLLGEMTRGTEEARAHTILHVTQSVDEARLASRVIIMHEGRVALDGPPDEVLSDEAHLRSLGILRRPGEARRCTPSEEQPLPTMEAVNVCYTRRDGAELRSVLHNVSASIHSATVLAIVGLSGSGKSTLAWHLNRLLEPTSGNVFLNGQDIAQIPRAELSRQVGLTFQQVDLQLFEATVGDDIAFGLRQQGIPESDCRRRLTTTMDALGLPFEHYAHRSPVTLSVGEQRRVALAGVLVTGPKVLVLDEATSGLDAAGVDALVDQINAADGLVWPGRAVVTHDGIVLLVVQSVQPELLSLGRIVQTIGKHQ